MSMMKDDPALRSEGDVNLGTQREAWNEGLQDATRQTLGEDETYFLRQSLSTPCLNVLEGAEGIYITDSTGKRYMDFHGNNVHQVGYGHPAVVQAVVNQMQTLPFCPRRYTNQPAIDLARRLSELAPDPLGKVLFAPGGANAMSMALKLARLVTGRHKTISMWDSFHGANLDTISIGGEAVFRKDAGPLLPGTEHAPPPDAHHCVFQCEGTCNLSCARYVEYILEKEGDVAAVVAETIRSTPFIPPADYWKSVKAACEKHGALLILDEIPHGLGRTGKLFTFEHYGIVPDMVVLGKGLGGGLMPLAALMADYRLDLGGDKALGHYTHEKSPLGAAAGLATLHVIEKEGLLEHANHVGTQALKRMESWVGRIPVVGNVRGLGLFLGVELIKPGTQNERAREAAERVMYACMEQGLSFKITMGNILTLSPPLIITEAQMNEALDIVESALLQVSKTEEKG